MLLKTKSKLICSWNFGRRCRCLFGFLTARGFCGQAQNYAACHHSAATQEVAACVCCRLFVMFFVHICSSFAERMDTLHAQKVHSILAVTRLSKESEVENACDLNAHQ